PFLDKAGIASRVDHEGAVEWILHDSELVWLDRTESLRDYLARKEDRVYRDVFRGLNLLSRAMMGFSIRLNYDGWPVDTLPAPFQAGAIATLWEQAPSQIQHLAQLSALEYLKPQLT
ncbi:MAG: hypothetical protein Q7S68_02475, partial [Deltaproteobacteria bacterium]|nr:hypothetical protein [Deltaproteobacteria bacterium]